MQIEQTSTAKFYKGAKTRVGWTVTFDSDSKNILVSTEEQGSVAFNVKVLRLREASGLEQLNIDARCQTAGGNITVSVMELSREILRLMSVGAVFDRSTYTALASTIVKHYHQFPIEEVDKLPGSTGIDDNDVYDVVSLIFADYFREENIQPKCFANTDEEYYLLPVREFAELLLYCPHKYLDVTELKKRLLEPGYTKANKGRTDYNTREFGK
jgi:hypothetical protein